MGYGDSVRPSINLEVATATLKLQKLWINIFKDRAIVIFYCNCLEATLVVLLRSHQPRCLVQKLVSNTPSVGRNWKYAPYKNTGTNFGGCIVAYSIFTKGVEKFDQYRWINPAVCRESERHLQEHVNFNAGRLKHHRTCDNECDIPTQDLDWWSGEAQIEKHWTTSSTTNWLYATADCHRATWERKKSNRYSFATQRCWRGK